MDDRKEQESSPVQPISIDKHASRLGLKEPKLGPAERVKFRLATWVLGAGATLIVLAWIINISVVWYLPDVGECSSGGAQASTPSCRYALQLLETRTTAAASVFEFAKTWIPPVITLVLGYYFARETAGKNDSDNG